MEKASKIGGCFGFVIAVLVLGYGYLESHNLATPSINDWLVFIACPSSLSLMAADSSTWPVVVFADLVVIVGNSVWYSFLFAVVAMLFSHGRKG
jgi:hypothetical protein